MRSIVIASVAVVALTAFSGCAHTPKKGKAKAKEDIRKPAEKSMPDASGDVSYQAFVGRLQKAVAARDVATLASMMTPNFGYLLEPKPGYPGEGEGVFKYWEEAGLWPELQAVVNEKFVPSGEFMVAPPQFAKDPAVYRGYRAGITRVSGSWKFAYFISG